MADDVYTTLLNFVSDSSEANRDIKQTTENLKDLEEEARKAAETANRELKIGQITEQFKGYKTNFSKAVDEVIGEAKRLGIAVREELAAEVDTGGMFTPARNEFSKLILAVERRKRELAAEEAKRNLVIPEATPAQLSAVPPELLQRAKELEEQGARIGTVFSKSFSQLVAGGYAASQALKRLETEIEQTITPVTQIDEAAARKAEEERKNNQELLKAHRIRAGLFAREASLLNKQAADIRQNSQIISNQAQQLMGVSQLVLGIGTGIVGGVFAFATKYVNSAKEATTVTVAWKEAQEKLKESGQKVGAVFAQEALPLLQKASDTAAKAAAFIEKHPEIVRAALNAGLVIAGLGAVGLAVSKGIKLYADQLYLSSIPLQLQAGNLQFAAAHEQLAAARLRAGVITPNQALPSPVPASGQRVPGIGNVLGTIAKITLVASSVIVGAELGLALGNALAKLIDPNAKDMNLKETLFYGGIRAIEALEQKWFNFLEKIGEAIPDLFGGKVLRMMGEAGNQNLQKVDKFFQELLLGADDLAKATEKLQGVRGSANFEQILKAYEDYKRDDLLLVQKHYSERQSVISDSLRAEAQAIAKYAQDAAKIRSNTAKAIAEATRNFEEQNRQAEINYVQERARIIRDGGLEIQRIEEQLQENLRKLRIDHEDRLEELVASRDALGIVKENQRYERERSELTRQANLEIRQRRADLALRLQDLEQNYQQERAQRLEDFNTRIEEIRNNSAEQLKELAARHQEELAEIRANRVERLQELDNQLKDERQRRYDYFIAQIRDLDAALLGEAELRKRRQDEMIAELDAFLLRYKEGLGTLLATPTGKATGGYATYGTYLLGDRVGGGRGKPEYVLSGDMTELAERVLGGQITRQKMSSLLNALQGGSRKNVIYNDSRRIDSPHISAADREQMIDDTLGALSTALE